MGDIYSYMICALYRVWAKVNTYFQQEVQRPKP